MPSKIMKTKTRITIKNPCKNNEKINYEDRKQGVECDLETGIWKDNQKNYEASSLLQNSGREFNASDENSRKEKLFNISGRFLPDPLYKKIGKFTTPTAPTTYLYIISKIMDGKTYFKIGEGGKGIAKGVGRLGDAQTFLIPGLEDGGYKVHYVFFFRKKLHYNSIHIGQYIEKSIHKVLRKYFQPTNIVYKNGEPSEWYLMQNNKEELFLLGFIFDIIGCYDHEKTKPLEIWKYNDTGRTKVKMPTGVIRRMRLDNTYKEIESKLGDFNLRKKQRPIGIIIDNNVVYAEQLPIIKRFFGISLRENLREKGYPLTFDNHKFDLIDFSTYSVSQLDKYSKYYAVLKPSEPIGILEEYLESKSIKFIIDDDKDVPHVLIGLKDFLNLYKEMQISEFDKWELKSIYNFYQSKEYENNIKEIAVESEKIPSWYSHNKVQLYWARKMTNDKEWKFHEERDEDGIIKRWETFGYDEEDGVRLKRHQVDSDNKKIEDTIDEVPVSQIMILMNVFKPDKINKGELKKKRSLLEKIEILSEGDENVEYKEGDIVEIRDDYFLWYDKFGEPDGLPHLEWQKYKIDMVYRNIKYDEEYMNPWIDVQFIGKGPMTNMRYELVANEYMHGKIRKISSAKKVIPVFKKGQTVRIPKSKSKYIFENESWHKHQHFVVIDEINKNEETYSIQTFFPFVNVIKIHMHVFHEHVTNESVDDKTLSEYKNDLLFKIMPIEEVDDHKPSAATSHLDLQSRRSPRYNVVYQDGNAHNMGIQTLQNAENVQRNAPSKVSRYWRTIRRGKPKSKKTVTRKILPKKSKLYYFETFADALPRAKQNWVDHHNNNIRNIKKNQSAYCLLYTSPSPRDGLLSRMPSSA